MVSINWVSGFRAWCSRAGLRIWGLVAQVCRGVRSNCSGGIQGLGVGAGVFALGLLRSRCCVKESAAACGYHVITSPTIAATVPVISVFATTTVLVYHLLFLPTVVSTDSIAMNLVNSTVVIYHNSSVRPASSRQEKQKLQAFDGG